jgi:hypothetical protein
MVEPKTVPNKVKANNQKPKLEGVPIKPSLI